jgi:hypothetical protein
MSKVWDMATVKLVRELRSKVTIAIYDIQQASVPEGEFIAALRKRAVYNFKEAASKGYGVTVDVEDMKFWEEPSFEEDDLGQRVSYKSVCCRWFPVTGTVELVRGPRDGERWTLQQGQVGQPLYVMEPALDPIWDMSNGDTIPTVDIRKLAYLPAGWSETERIWLYSPQRY